MKSLRIKRRHGVRVNNFADNAVAQQVGLAFGRVPVLAFLFAYMLFCRVFIGTAPGIEILMVFFIKVFPVGFNRSTGDIMTWINSDDRLHPNSLSAVASIFVQFEEIDWVTGTPSTMNEKGELTWECSIPPVYSREYYLEKKYDYPKYIQQEGTFWRRSLWEKAGGRLKTSLKMAGDLERVASESETIGSGWCSEYFIEF